MGIFFGALGRNRLEFRLAGLLNLKFFDLVGVPGIFSVFLAA